LVAVYQVVVEIFVLRFSSGSLLDYSFLDLTILNTRVLGCKGGISLLLCGVTVVAVAAKEMAVIASVTKSHRGSVDIGRLAIRSATILHVFLLSVCLRLASSRWWTATKRLLTSMGKFTTRTESGH
jgi:hypothetical protein